MENYEKLRSFYENEGLEELRLQEDSVQYLEFLTASKYLEQCLPAGVRLLDSCAGTGVYSFFLAEQGLRVTAGDIVPRNVGLLEERQAKSPVLEAVYQGDALDLSRFEGGEFQAVLCMGALYHLAAPDERRKAVAESWRVLAEGGMFACTYMNRYAVILNNLRGSLENIEEVLRFADDGREGVFYASTPEEMTALVEDSGFRVRKHIALDGPALFLHQSSGMLDDEGLRRLREYHWKTCEEPSLLGYSYHNLLLCQK